MGVFCLRKNRIWRRLSKLSIAMFICVFILISNPIYWPSQIYRHLDTSTIITPNAPAVQHLNDTSQFWAYINSTYGINGPCYKSLTDYQKVHLVEHFILDKIQYLNIQYIWFVIDYVATPTEVLERGVGDCQHRTVVMVSFLIYLGFDAYCAECPLHWYPVVFLKNGSITYLYHVNWTQPEILINDHNKIFLMDLPTRLYDALTHFSLNEPLNALLNTPFFWIILIPLSFGMSGSLVLIIKTSGNPSKKKSLYNILFGGISLIIGLLFTTILGNIYIPISLTIILITIIITVQLISHNFFLFRKLSRNNKNVS
ncbi:MAG: hypothetical protein ACTSQO_03040 [Candidatus Helarchaeota archaeon]